MGPGAEIARGGRKPVEVPAASLGQRGRQPRTTRRGLRMVSRETTRPRLKLEAAAVPRGRNQRARSPQRSLKVAVNFFQ